ncbi:MAG: hypothetical protein CSA20_09305 [Deltaproteobacteria bacterium]|nr:MAG: hypothetical protein CSB23_00155 [Deltaproteobacteria bacterium]PIE72136.1 MAG: hypothetical protein CSA20_09305 [Deltaproteobacteria bacterium]
MLTGIHSLFFAGLADGKASPAVPYNSLYTRRLEKLRSGETESYPKTEVLGRTPGFGRRAVATGLG